MGKTGKAAVTGNAGGWRFAAFLGIFVAVIAAVELGKGGFYIGKHEGDTLHLLQMVLRMARGDWPHLDFVTPIGVFALLPIVAFLKLGLGVGMAFMAGQVLVAVLFLPAIWWVGVSRFHGGWRYLFGAAVLTLILALVDGGSVRAVSLSMHYNRWAWAAAFLVLSTAILPGRDRVSPVADGLVIGVFMAVLALIKVTYFVGFAPAVLVALVSARAGRTLIWALAGGIAIAALMTALGGIGFWGAYLGDLLVVRGSQVRPQPSATFGDVVSAPAYLAGSLLALLSIVLLRQAGRDREPLVMLFLVPGFFYVTFQNFGNDPQWLVLLGVMLWMLLPGPEAVNSRGWNLRLATQFTAIAALALAVPSYSNLFFSPINHLSRDVSDYVPLVPNSGRNEDLQISRMRARQISGEVPLDGPGTRFAAFVDADLREEVLTSFQGEDLPICGLTVGMAAWFTAMAADLKASGLAEGRTVFTADLLSAFWLYGAFEPLPGASPWYYGGLPGFDAADYVLVPLCPISPPVRRLVLKAVTQNGAELQELRRNDMYILYRKL